MNFQNIKTHWVFSLKNCIVAGGFFRDNILGFPVKDIDIYCLPDNLKDIKTQLHHRVAEDITESIRRKAKAGQGVSAETVAHYEQQRMLDIVSINRYRTYQGEVIDLIETHKATSVLDLISTFDYTVNAIGWPSENSGIAYNNSTWRDLWNMDLRSINEASEERKKYMINKGFREVT